MTKKILIKMDSNQIIMTQTALFPGRTPVDWFDP